MRQINWRKREVTGIERGKLQSERLVRRSVQLELNDSGTSYPEQQTMPVEQQCAPDMQEFHSPSRASLAMQTDTCIHQIKKDKCRRGQN